MIEGIAARDIQIVLLRGDRPDYDLSPDFRAEYHRRAVLEGSTIRLTGKRIITDPGRIKSMAGLRYNVAGVTGSATLR